MVREADFLLRLEDFVKFLVSRVVQSSVMV
jgi:hypothetical protein